MGGANTGVRISAIIPMYGVEPYLPELLQSLSAQEPGDYEVDYIFVDDGSPDRSGELAEQWLSDSGATGRVIRQENAGVSAARNRGLSEATGEWVTFPDSDDVLDRHYFRNVARYIRRDGDRVSLVATRLLRLYDADGSIQDVHALQFRFAAGNRRVSMSRYPDFFQMNAASSFFRRTDLERTGVRFPLGLHASEDAMFVADFLLRSGGEPVLGLVADASYIYRRRATADSAVDLSRIDPVGSIGRFHDAYLPLMQRAAANGEVPAWLQSMFLYECQWLLAATASARAERPELSEADASVMRETLADCARFVDEDVLFRYDASALPLEARLLLQLLAGRRMPAWVGAYRDRAGGIDVPIARGADVSVVDPNWKALAITGERTVPEHFGQQVLEIWHGAVPDGAHVVVDGVARVEVRRRWEDQPAQQWDRHRRRSVGLAAGALPSRAGEVRVWKPVPGPFGSFGPRAYWRLRVWGRRVARIVRKTRGRN